MNWVGDARACSMRGGHCFRLGILFAASSLLFLIHSQDAAVAAKQSKRVAPKEVSLSTVLGPRVSALLESAVPKATCATGEHHPTLGLWTFPAEKTPVSEGAAKRLYDELLSQVLKSKPHCLDVLDSQGIGAVIKHLSLSGALEEAGGNALLALEKAHQDVDFVMFPELFEQKGELFLSLRIAERLSGRTAAVSQPILIPRTFAGAEAGDRATTLDNAVALAARTLLEGEVDITAVTPEGIFFEDSNAQPEAGRFLLEQLLSKLVERAANPITGKALKVRAISVEEASPTPADDTGPGTILPEERARKDGSYLLSGRYWVRDDAFDLILSLVAPDGARKMWRGAIKVSEFNGMDLEPRNAAAKQVPLPPSNYSFEVTTTRGTNPVFKVGDELNLRISLGREAWVYCFYVDSAGGVTPIFPLPVDLAHGRVNPLAARKTVLLPDPAHDKFRFRFSADTTGEELVSCYATRRDVGSSLPPGMFPDKVTTVPFLTLDAVRERFRSLAEASVTEALVTMTVAR